MGKGLLAVLILLGSSAPALALTPLTLAPTQVQYETGIKLDPVIVDEDMEFWAELDADGNVYMDWSRYNHSEPFTHYKIVRSQTNDKPLYPEDGYIFYTPDIDTLTYTDTNVPVGISHYRICMVAEPKRYCSAEIYSIEKTPVLTKDLRLQTDKEVNFTDIAKIDALKTEGEKSALVPSESELVAPRKPIVDAISSKPTSKGNSSIESFISEYWVQFLALVVSLIGVALAVTGFTVAGAKKKKSVTRFIHQIDDTFASFKWKSKRCEAELYRLHDLIDDQLKNGRIDEGAYELLNKRIDKYLAEIKEIDSLPPHLKEKE